MYLYMYMEKELLELNIIKYFEGSLSQGEQSEVERWIEASEENRLLAKEYYEIYQTCLFISSSDSVESEIALSKVKNRISKTKRGAWRGYLLKIVAIMAIPLLISSIYLGWRLDKEINTLPPEITITTAGGVISSTTLPDGSQVWLNSNSKLTYPSNFNKNRTLTLEGEGYFKVKPQERNKFIVSASGVDIEVKGTEFNVENYSNLNSQVRTTLINGSVIMRYSDLENNMHQVSIKPSECYEYNIASSELTYSKVNTTTIASWKDGKIVLKNTSLEEALRMIGNRFNIEFLVKNEELLKNRYTGTFTGQRLEVILEHFSRTTNMKFEYSFKGVDGENHIGRQVILVY